MSESYDFFEKRKPESSRMKMKSAREVSSDRTVREARGFERLNVNLEAQATLSLSR